MSLKGAQYEKAEAVEQVVRNGVEKLRAIPGVVERERHLLRAARRADTGCRSGSSAVRSPPTARGRSTAAAAG